MKMVFCLQKEKTFKCQTVTLWSFSIVSLFAPSFFVAMSVTKLVIIARMFQFCSARVAAIFKKRMVTLLPELEPMEDSLESEIQDTK
jgi:hypothetical protein